MTNPYAEAFLEAERTLDKSVSMMQKYYELTDAEIIQIFKRILAIREAFSGQEQNTNTYTAK